MINSNVRFLIPRLHFPHHGLCLLVHKIAPADDMAGASLLCHGHPLRFSDQEAIKIADLGSRSLASRGLDPRELKGLIIEFNFNAPRSISIFLHQSLGVNGWGFSRIGTVAVDAVQYALFLQPRCLFFPCLCQCQTLRIQTLESPTHSSSLSSHVPISALFPSLPFRPVPTLGLTCCGADTIA